MEVFADNSRLVRGLKAARGHLRNFGAGVSSMGKSMVGMGVAAAAPIAMAVAIFTTFSDRMAEVRAITGANEAQFAQLEVRAKELGRTTSFSASQAAEGMKFLGMAGFTTEQILAGIPGVLNLARAGAVDLGLAADIASDVGSAFGMAADEIGHLGDVLAKTATSANTSIEMMGESFKFAAPVARAAGQSLEETAAAMGLLGNNAVKASMAGTDIKNLLTVMAQNSDLGFGVKAVDQAGNMRPLLDVMRDLGQATAGLAQADRLAFFMDRFGKISGKSALILAAAGEQVDVMREKLGAADGAAAKAAETMDDNLGGSIRMLLSAVEGVAIEIGTALAPMLRSWADSLQAVSGWISRTVSKNRELLAGIVKGIAVAIGIGVALVAVGAAASGMAAALSLAIGIVAAVKAALLAVGAAVAFLMSPIGMVIGGLTALATWFVTSTEAGGAALDWLKDRFAALWAGATEAIGGIGDALAAGDLSLAADVLWTSLQMAWQQGVASLNETWAGARDFFLDVWSGAVTTAAGLMIDSWAGLRTAWVETVAFFQQAWIGAVDVMRQGMLSLTTSMGLSQIDQLEESGKISPMIADGLRTALGGFSDAAAKAGTQQTAKAFGKSEQTRQDQLAQIEADRTGAQAELQAQAAADRAAREAASAAAGGELQQKLAMAQAEYRDALERAAAARDAAGAGESGGESLADRLKQALEGGIGVAAAAAGGTKVLGSFNAAAARGFGAVGPEKQIADATKKTAENTALLVKQMKKQTGPAFT